MNLHIYPSALVGASRIQKIAKSIHEVGLFDETHVVGVHAEGTVAEEEIADCVKVRRLRGTTRKGLIGRILKVAMWQPRVYREYHRRDLATVAAHNVWVLPLAAHLAKRAGAVLVYNAHELETETVSMASSPGKRFLAKVVENWYLKKAVIVSVVNDPIADWYEAHYSISRPIPVRNVPQDDGTVVNLRALIEIPPDSMLYVHTGHLVQGRHIPLILEVFSSQSAAHVVFLGDGKLRTEVEAAAKRSPNVHWLPPVSPDAVLGHVRSADVGLCLIEYVSLSGRLSTPNKLMEALCAGIPVLVSDLIEARNLLTHNSELWILERPEEQLSEVARTVGKTDVTAFKENRPGLSSWEEQIQPLVEAYRQAVDA